MRGKGCCSGPGEKMYKCKLGAEGMTVELKQTALFKWYLVECMCTVNDQMRGEMGHGEGGSPGPMVAWWERASREAPGRVEDIWGAPRKDFRKERMICSVHCCKTGTMQTKHVSGFYKSGCLSSATRATQSAAEGSGRSLIAVGRHMEESDCRWPFD